jgi:23S rRNA-/tRNA-specific pseudouridylate synthase
MVVHPSARHYSGTLVNGLMFHCKDSLSGINGVIRPGIVHRIDKDTTGSLIVCKTDQAHVGIAEQIKEHSCNRKYRGIVLEMFPRMRAPSLEPLAVIQKTGKKWRSTKRTENRL